MDFRQLNYFITIAELGSIAAASRTLHIAQPALSRQIHNLEERLNVPLFKRHSRGVSLTPAGKQFYKDALTIQQRVDIAKTDVIKANRGELGSLNIGITPHHLWLTEIQQHLSEFRLHHPEISLNIYTLQSQPQVMALREEFLDAGFLFLRPEEDNSLVGRPIYKESVMLAVHKDSRFAKNPPDDIKELMNESFIWVPKRQSFYLHHLIIQEMERRHFSPDVIHHGHDFSSILCLISAGMGYSFVPAVTKYLNPYNVIFHSLDHFKIDLTLELIWRKNNSNPCLEKITRNYQPQMRRLT